MNTDQMRTALASFKVREVQCREKERLRRILVLSQRLDNVLEHTPQSLIKILFVLVSLSSTAVPAVRGVEAVWNSLAPDASWFDYVSFRLSPILSAVGLFTGHHLYTQRPEEQVFCSLRLGDPSKSTCSSAIISFMTPSAYLLNRLHTFTF